MERQELEQRDYDALLSALNQTALVSVTDSKGDITYANQKFVDVSKYTLQELLGQNHRILKSGDQPDELFDDLWKTISQGNIWRGEIKNKAKDGSYYWVDTSIAPIFTSDSSTEPDKYIAVRVLISDKKAAQKELQEKVDHLEKINEAMVGRELKMIELKKEIERLTEEVEKNKK